MTQAQPERRKACTSCGVRMINSCGYRLVLIERVVGE
jgi:hypothetical protein